MLRKINSILLLSALFFACNNETSHDHSGNKAKDSTVNEIVIRPTDTTITDTVKKSLPAIAKSDINGHDVVIRYHSPAMRGRIIWGGLVPLDQVWVTGAHSATSIEVPTGFVVGEKKIPAGKYAFFTIPTRGAWTVIINKNWDQHLADEYNQAEDLVRITVSPDAAARQERLMYTIDQTGERKCAIELRWDTVRLRVPVELVN